jgi:hypothetical protein
MERGGEGAGRQRLLAAIGEHERHQNALLLPPLHSLRHVHVPCHLGQGAGHATPGQPHGCRRGRARLVKISLTDDAEGRLMLPFGMEKPRVPGGDARATDRQPYARHANLVLLLGQDHRWRTVARRLSRGECRERQRA